MFPKINPSNSHFLLGWAESSDQALVTEEEALRDALYRVGDPLYILDKAGRYAFGTGSLQIGPKKEGLASPLPVLGLVPPCSPENLGSLDFCRDYGLKYPYIAGSMAKGISSIPLVSAMAHGGMMAFFGSAGLSLDAIEVAIDELSSELPNLPYGFNLIHSPNEPDLERAVVELYLKRGVSLVEASAYLDLTPWVVHYRVHGIHQNHLGEIITPNRLIAKVSRIEVAEKFFSPPPDKILNQLIQQNKITREESRLASYIPMSQDVTAEADSGGHTDNRPALSMIPTMVALKEQMDKKYSYVHPLRLGAGGGISTPASAGAAFAMGADFIVTGSINQSCVESGTSKEVRQMLAEARQGDITMAPSADMFEMGVKVQVLKRGTMFGMKAGKLYELYRSHESLESLPHEEKKRLEKNFFRTSLEDIWQKTQDFFQQRDPRQIEKAEKNPKHKMVLLFRWYLGQASNWANSGEASRKIDYQIWCGPAMGAFNQWVKGSFLALPENRKVKTLGLNILFGTALSIRLNSLRWQGVNLPPHLCRISPLEEEMLTQYL